MRSEPLDPRWARLLSLSVHEFRTPLTVVAGYLRMLLKDRAGPLSEQQRRLIEEAEKSCSRLSLLLAEMSELSGLEAGTATFNRGLLDLHGLIVDAIAALPELADRLVTVELRDEAGSSVEGDETRLKKAMTSVIAAVRREIVGSDRLILRQILRLHDDRRIAWIAIAEPDRAAALGDADESALATFDEWRGGSGLSLPVARRIIEAHGGRLWSPRDDAKASAIIALPAR